MGIFPEFANSSHGILTMRKSSPRLKAVNGFHRPISYPLIEANRPMKKLIPFVCVLLQANPAIAQPVPPSSNKVSMETCLQAARAKLKGDVVKLELKNERGVPTYEFEIEGKERTMEFECDANTGQITEEEQEVESPEHPSFKSKQKSA